MSDRPTSVTSGTIVDQASSSGTGSTKGTSLAAPPRMPMEPLSTTSPAKPPHTPSVRSTIHDSLQGTPVVRTASMTVTPSSTTTPTAAASSSSTPHAAPVSADTHIYSLNNDDMGIFRQLNLEKGDASIVKYYVELVSLQQQLEQRGNRGVPPLHLDFTKCEQFKH